MWLYSSLFISALSSATLLPGSSEILLSSLALENQVNLISLWLVATMGNVLGSCINYWLGMNLMRFKHRRWFPVSIEQINKAQLHYKRYGSYSLLLAWLPIIGDPLTVFAGVFAMKKRLFLLLITIGKGVRYAMVIAVAVKVEQLI
ncbi:Inner membrane protein YqaA [Pseudoalteromonas holothuriae]|uniref:Inner membrane protein YqaA n=1 Tax=Pseudoalteromonas holothuriae TaxID=2963714 RepID=A0A9W4R3I3_9GAMM|nr:MULTISPECIES: YqaA family protein [unclassified Pseudoalteromonas]CAH9065438.1 Inner membrane protein YqaA [Pseudoalteromonas sp. CIP111854]CAH9067121.1 Inner membrane protein YqaA [Pseudoalteromonas sp. CIP111951]